MPKQASVHNSGSWSKRLLLNLGERATSTVRVFSKFSSRNILKFSLVQNLLHIRGYFIQNRLAIGSSAANIHFLHTTIFIQFLPLLQFFWKFVIRGSLSYLFVLTLLCAVGTGVEISEKPVYFILPFVFELFLIFSCKYFVIFYL